jgi:tetratricopeptide (TPR) repeat protein
MRRAAIVMFLATILGTTLAAQRWSSADAQRATKHYQTGWEHMSREAWAEAAKEFREAISIDSKFALAYYALGRAEVYQHKFADAIKSYLKCREIYLARANERFGSQLDANKALDDQIFEWKDYLAKQFKGSETERRHLDNQLSEMQQARQRNTSLTMEISVPYFVPLALGSAYFRNSQFVDAVREYRAAIEANPSSGETHNNLAVIYLTADRLDEAAKEIALAEKSGYKVNPGLKDELKQKMGK